jgi:energy-coupling factor transporter transmembrane protein EcfT
MNAELRERIRDNLLSGTTWLRAFFMLMFGVICYYTMWIAFILVFFQFCVVLLSGKLNERLLPIGQSISLYIHQILEFITYNSDEKPFPFNSWPTPNEYDTKPVVSLPKEPEPPQKNDNIGNGA